MAWFDNVTEWGEEWGEDRDYDDITTCPSLELQAWYEEMRKTYPPMNGPYALSDDQITEDIKNKLTDYCIADQVIYTSFRWSEEAEAYNLVRSLAKKHRVGLM